MVSFRPAFVVSFFTLIRKFFSSSSLSVIRVVPSAYLRLLIFLLAVWIPACDSSSLAFCMIYSAYKFNKQGDITVYSLVILLPNFELVHCSMSGSYCCFLTYLQVSQETDNVMWFSHLLKNFLAVCCGPHIQSL